MVVISYVDALLCCKTTHLKAPHLLFTLFFYCFCFFSKWIYSLLAKKTSGNFLLLDDTPLSLSIIVSFTSGRSLSNSHFLHFHVIYNSKTWFLPENRIPCCLSLYKYATKPPCSAPHP